MSFPVKLTFEYKLPDELDDETIKQITRHIYKSNDMWIFHEYLGVEKYVHLTNPDYLWIWTDRKNTNIFGITKNFEVIEISNDLKEFQEILSSNKIESSRQSYSHFINLISHNELFANRFRNALTVSGCVCWCSLHKEEMYELSVETTSKYFLKN